MNKQQALKKAVRLWGKDAAVRDDGEVTSAEKRAAAGAALTAKLEHKNSLSKEQYLACKKDLEREISRLRSACCKYRYSVGKIWTMCGFGMFSVNGQGDTWEAAFKAAENSTRAVKRAVGR